MINNKPTYISLFSSAGVGCYGFKLENFECIATNELLERRLNIQKLNNKCKYDSGYIKGDITLKETKDLIYNEINLWKQLGNDKVDVIIATPPCQGMSVANHKKRVDEINRNSLIVQSVELIKKIQPRFFIFENVSAFWKTGCVYNDQIISIGEMIKNHLSNDYVIQYRVLNFKNYGSNSSRTRTLVIGVNKNDASYISTFELFPSFQEEKTIKEVIGDLKELEWAEYDPDDFYHSFRTYPAHMKEWIKDLKESQSAFDNILDSKKPHKIVDGKIVINKSKNGDKYKRQSFSKVAPCIHTRSDQLASQNTIHPKQNRVFSIRELMKLMTIPSDFKWLDLSLEQLNKLTNEQKQKLSKKEELNIRQSIGEAVPTEIFRKIAFNIKKYLLQKKFTDKEVEYLIKINNLNSFDNLIEFIKNNKDDICFSSLAKIIELANSYKEQHSAFYTPTILLNHIYSVLPEFNKKEINVLEPSVGAGSFLNLILKKYEQIEKINLYVVDINSNNIEILKLLFSKGIIPNNVEIHYIISDYLNTNFNIKFDLIIGNPPFGKLSSAELKKYSQNSLYSQTLTNVVGLFLEKSIKISDNVSFILPKNFLNTKEFALTRLKLKDLISSIIDFNELGFKDVLIETINLTTSITRQSKVFIKSVVKNIEIYQDKDYIFDSKLPYWVIYRNSFFDNVFSKLIFDVFSVFRDRQITNKYLDNTNGINKIRVLKSRNINDTGTEIINLKNYDSYIDEDIAKNLIVFNYLDNDNVYLTPNMTYKPRLLKKQKGYIANGSIAILKNKSDYKITQKQLEYISSKEFREFYTIARNYQTRSLNIDSLSVFWFGINKEI
ncbi:MULTISPECIES: DNA cytosine methyltransferase [Mycoplasma mycoides group]|uniref:DNA (cytosine-5-)-methyltransferase n=2 Tax=Mycoplasma mycoides group TaxID=656088 RepID=A0A0C2VG13_MYCCA|nr:MULTISPECIES: DNA cytosine methyltransferase [Mycoplasma mycoides group]ADH21829.1 CCTTC-recognizing Type II restriction modification system (MmyCII) adenine/cytosine DNA methyltransferase subunit [synthetic Mycoplasma mycoides JCVI-syn1.0]ACU78264.1 CCTTC-recognizing Type II restriction modification system (MmyCII) adenine/cytosine DNA methyltransferase subunit [Mycoplasma mycoides subsp. capri str. GM12]ACU79094.1 CCTTC-recognizing Type II restriction modification system (MmyCII) adenine/cy